MYASSASSCVLEIRHTFKMNFRKYFERLYQKPHPVNSLPKRGGDTHLWVRVTALLANSNHPLRLRGYTVGEQISDVSATTWNEIRFIQDVMNDTDGPAPRKEFPQIWGKRV